MPSSRVWKLSNVIDVSRSSRSTARVAVSAPGPTSANLDKHWPSPQLPDVCNRIERAGKPVVAVLHGVALGGGLELALAAHVRVGTAGLRLGLPEVSLGLIPGAGGTQRLPRLLGLAAALDLITSGRQISAEQALELGVLDKLADGDPREAALVAAEDVLAGRLTPRVTGDMATTQDDAAVSTARAAANARRPRLSAPLRCIDAVTQSLKPLQDGAAGRTSPVL